MEINITEFATARAFNFSHSVHEGGNNAGKNTWDAATSHDQRLLKTPEQMEAFKKHIREFGAWKDEEIAAWDEEELNGLFIQLIAGDIREAGADTLEEIDWEEFEELSQAGQISGNLFKTDAGEYYYQLSY